MKILVFSLSITKIARDGDVPRTQPIQHAIATFPYSYKLIQAKQIFLQLLQMLIWSENVIGLNTTWVDSPPIQYHI